MRKNQQGFTLIELMIVVAIVGILAAIAIPAYRDYITRSKVSECAATLSACKTSVTESYLTNNAFPADTDEAGCDSTNTSQYCGAVTVPGNIGGASGSMSIVVLAATTGVAADCELELSPTTANKTITAWTGATDCDEKFVPATFR